MSKIQSALLGKVQSALTPRTPEGLQRIVKARTVHGADGAEMRELRRMMRALDEERRRVLELVK